LYTVRLLVGRHPWLLPLLVLETAHYSDFLKLATQPPACISILTIEWMNIYYAGRRLKQ
jgi:hypothetical protein